MLELVDFRKFECECYVGPAKNLKELEERKEVYRRYAAREIQGHLSKVTGIKPSPEEERP